LIPRRSDIQDGRYDSERNIHLYQKQLRRLASQLSLAEARERREIAADLHDRIGQALAFVSQKLNILRGNSIFSGREKDFSEILSILEQTIRYTRNLTVEISPPVLYDLGLAAAIDWLVERATQRYEFEVTLNQVGRPREISEDIKVFLFKAIQELLNNVAKHAEADRVDISVGWRATELEVVVRDNGRGFDAIGVERRLTEGNCFGLFNIRERLSYIGGALTVNSAPGEGTRISLIAPYRTSDEDERD
jgi:signal transduction histidine kinase